LAEHCSGSRCGLRRKARRPDRPASRTEGRRLQWFLHRGFGESPRCVRAGCDVGRIEGPERRLQPEPPTNSCPPARVWHSAQYPTPPRILPLPPVRPENCPWQVGWMGAMAGRHASARNPRRPANPTTLIPKCHLPNSSYLRGRTSHSRNAGARRTSRFGAQRTLPFGDHFMPFNTVF
jgi:hypothetical protein